MSKSNIYVGVAGFIGQPNAEGSVGIFRRSIEGEQWEHVYDERETYTVYVHPGDPTYIFAGTDNGVWRSEDNGKTFQRTHFPQGKTQIWSFLTCQDAPDIMYAGASPIEIYKSIDRGTSWEKLSTPDIKERCSGPFSPRVMRMVQKPGDPNTIYAALEIAGAIRTTDGGETWDDISNDLVQLAESPHLQSSIVQDKTLAEGMLDAHAITISPSKPNTVLIALRMGLFKTSNRGKNWEDMKIKRYSPTTYARDLKVSPQNPNIIYAALSVAAASHDGGIYKSDDAGETWKRFDKIKVNGTIMSIGLHTSDPEQVYVGARYNGEVFGTRDGGINWFAIPLPGGVKDIYSVACG